VARAFVESDPFALPAVDEILNIIFEEQAAFRL
jgi:hypothetical protein